MRDDLKRFLESMMAKSGKLRALIRELRTAYSGDVAATQFLFWVMKVDIPGYYDVNHNGQYQLIRNILYEIKPNSFINSRTLWMKIVVCQPPWMIQGASRPWRRPFGKLTQHMTPATKLGPGARLTSFALLSCSYEFIFSKNMFINKTLIISTYKECLC